MQDRFNWMIGIPGVGLLVVVALALIGGGPPAAKTGEPGGPSPDLPPATAGPHGPATPEGFLADTRVVADPTTRPPAVAPGRQVRTLVLLLPDPVGSQFGYLHDQGTDAAIRALGSAGYVLEGHWFPWEAIGEKDKQPVYRGDPAVHPGVMVFRNLSRPDSKLVILTAGEDPVTGVRPRAFAAALELAYGLESPRRQAVVAAVGAAVGPAIALDAGEVRVVGPNFTGSQPSLADVVLRWRPAHPAPRVRFVSGGATGLVPWWKLGLDNAPAVVARCGTEVSTTSVPLAEQRRAALHYLATPGRVPTDRDIVNERPPPFRYARLIEGNTGYGAAQKEDSVDLAFQVRFPLHVGRVAGVLAREQRARDERLGLKYQGRLTLTPADAKHAGRDLLPAADEARTAALSMERLERAWGVFRREGIRHVEIIATDPRDRLFLIQLVRQHCPNAVPFVYNMDLLLGHPDYLPATRGTVVVTTYPLRPDHQGRTGQTGVGNREAFATSSSAGTYNALLTQLDRRDLMLDYAPPDVTGGAEHTSPPDTTGGAKHTFPPVWITAIGENGDPVPLAYFTNYRTDGMVRGTPPPKPGDHHPPHRAALRYLGLGVIAAGVLVAVLIGRAVGRGGPPGPLLAGHRTLFAILAVGGVAFAALPPFLYFQTLASHGWVMSWADRLVSVGLGAVTLGVVLWVAYLVVPVGFEVARWAAGRRGADADPEPAVRPHGTWAGTVVAAAAGAAMFGWVWADHAGLDHGRHWLFVERAGELDTGASPIIPGVAFAAGFGLYGAIGLVVVRELARHRVPCPYPAAVKRATGPAQARFAEAAAEVGRQGADLDRCLGSPEWVFAQPLEGWPAAPDADAGRWARARHRLTTLVPWAGLRWSGVGLLVLAGLGCAMILFRAHATWEAAGWNWLFAAGFVGLAFLTVVAAYRLYLGWKGVERLTAAILSVPMAGTFDRLPDKVSRLFGRYLLASRRRLRDRDVLLYIRDRAVAAMGSASSGQAAVVLRAYEQWEADEAEARLAAAARVVARRGPDPDLEEDDVAGLCRLSGRLVERLIPVWAADGRPVGAALGTVPVEPGKESPEPREPGGWVDRAEQFVGLMAVVYLSQYLVRLRRLAVMAAVAAGALLTAATAYQFQPEGLIMTGGMVAAGGVVLLILWVLAQINRNELVSRVCRSTPNRFNLDGAFVSNVVTLVLPLVLVVAAQFAGRTRAIVEPVLGWFQ